MISFTLDINQLKNKDWIQPGKIISKHFWVALYWKFYTGILWLKNNLKYFMMFLSSLVYLYESFERSFVLLSCNCSCLLIIDHETRTCIGAAVFYFYLFIHFQDELCEIYTIVCMEVSSTKKDCKLTNKCATYFLIDWSTFISKLDKKQAGAELCQAQFKLD